MELKLISLLGWLTMIAAAWVISYNRKNFPWRTVIWGIGLQFLLALLILKTPWGGALFEFAGKVVQKLIQFSTEGTKFVSAPSRMQICSAKLSGRNTVWFLPSSSPARSSSWPRCRRCFITGEFCSASCAPSRG
jgi:hypothetical protein